MTHASLHVPLGSRVHKNTGWRLFLQTVIARAYPRIIGQQREKSWMFFEIFLPLLAVSAYVFVYRAIRRPEEYIGFVVMGGAMTAFWMNMLWSMSSQLYWEKEQGNLALYIMAPNSMMAILLGMALGGMFATTLRAAGDHRPGQPDVPGAVCQVSSYLQLFAVFMLAMTALYGMGMMLASLFLLLEPRSLAHGQPGPGADLTWFRAFTSRSRASASGWPPAASLIPLTLGMDAMRQLIFPSGLCLWFLAVPGGDRRPAGAVRRLPGVWPTSCWPTWKAWPSGKAA